MQGAALQETPGTARPAPTLETRTDHVLSSSAHGSVPVGYRNGQAELLTAYGRSIVTRISALPGSTLSLLNSGCLEAIGHSGGTQQFLLVCNALDWAPSQEV